MPRRSALLIIIWAAMIGVGIVTLGSAIVAIVQRSYAVARGGRNRESGISCESCGRTAFPIAGTGTRYRCWNCGNRFDGQRHFD
jgi:hypothetical protein